MDSKSAVDIPNSRPIFSHSTLALNSAFLTSFTSSMVKRSDFPVDSVIQTKRKILVKLTKRHSTVHFTTLTSNVT